MRKYFFKIGLFALIFIINVTFCSFKYERFKTWYSDSDSLVDYDDSSINQLMSSTSGTTFYDYFYNLRYNIGDNEDEMGSCGYVAISMLLSYYDTYWNDNIIAEQYDKISNGSSISQIKSNSPGILRESFTSNELSNATNCYNAILSKRYTYFECELIASTNEALNYYNQPYSPTYCALNDNQMYYVLSNYLNSRNINYSINSFSENYVNNGGLTFVKNELDSGRPVLVGVKDFSTNEGHSMIAYDYEIINGEIILYYNYGYYGMMYHTTSDSTVVEAYSLNINSTHSHSNNYYCSSDNSYYCMCDINSNHPNHYHSYNYSYSHYNQTYHKALCKCQKFIKQLHSDIDFDGTCDLCNYHH